MKNKQISGFTLLELIISLTILSVIVVIIFSGFRVGVRAWEKGEKDVETRQRHRIVLNLIKRQLSSICLRSISFPDRSMGTRESSETKENSDSRTKEKKLSFKMENNSLEFISYIPLNPINTYGMVYVRYMIESEEENKARLMFYEKNIISFDKDTNTDELIAEDFYELIPEVYNIEFEYLKGVDENNDFVWVKPDAAEGNEEIPPAFKIIFQKDELSEPINVIARTDQNKKLEKTTKGDDEK